MSFAIFYVLNFIMVMAPLLLFLSPATILDFLCLAVPVAVILVIQYPLLKLTSQGWRLLLWPLILLLSMFAFLLVWGFIFGLRNGGIEKGIGLAIYSTLFGSIYGFFFFVPIAIINFILRPFIFSPAKPINPS